MGYYGGYGSGNSWIVFLVLILLLMGYPYGGGYGGGGFYGAEK